MPKDNGNSWKLNEKLVLTKIQEHSDEIKTLRDHIYRSEKSICQKIEDLGKDLTGKIVALDQTVTNQVRLPFEGIKVKLGLIVTGIALVVSITTTVITKAFFQEGKNETRVTSTTSSTSSVMPKVK